MFKLMPILIALVMLCVAPSLALAQCSNGSCGGGYSGYSMGYSMPMQSYYGGYVTSRPYYPPPTYYTPAPMTYAPVYRPPAPMGYYAPAPVYYAPRPTYGGYYGGGNCFGGSCSGGYCR